MDYRRNQYSNRDYASKRMNDRYNDFKQDKCPCRNTNRPMYQKPYYADPYRYRSDREFGERRNQFRDFGPGPFVVNITEASKMNDNFRTTIWTGEHLQLTLMSIDVGGDIGLEIHPDVDQFIRIEEGDGLVMMGDRMDRLDFQAEVYDDYALIIPAGTYHNLVNTGNIPIKLYSIYAPPQHPHGTIHETKADAMAAEED